MAAQLENIRIEYRLGITVPTAQFANLRPEYCISADIAPGTNIDEAFTKIKDKVDALLEADVAAIEEEIG